MMLFAYWSVINEQGVGQLAVLGVGHVDLDGVFACHRKRVDQPVANDSKGDEMTPAGRKRNANGRARGLDGLTDHQRALYQAMHKLLIGGSKPTCRRLAKMFGSSREAVHETLKQLRRLNLVELTEGEWKMVGCTHVTTIRFDPTPQGQLARALRDGKPEDIPVELLRD